MTGDQLSSGPRAVVVVRLVGDWQAQSANGMHDLSNTPAQQVVNVARPLRGQLLMSQGAEHVLAFTTMAKALTFAADLMMVDGPLAGCRIGVDIGEISHRGDNIHGTVVTNARALSAAASEAGAQVLVSKVVRDLASTVTSVVLTEVVLDSPGPVLFGPVFELVSASVD